METTTNSELDYLAQGTSRHIFLCKEILQALNTSMLSESGVGIGSATLTSLWASSISKSHLQTGQPYLVRVTPARENAVASISNVSRWREIPTYVSWHQQLSSNQLSLVVDRTDLNVLFREIYGVALSCKNAAPGEIKNWARELAVILGEREQWGRSFSKALRQAVSDERSTPGSAIERIDSLLQRHSEPHLVVVGVSGATAIEGLDLLAGSSIRVLKDDNTSPSFPNWGSAGGDAKDFIDFVCQPSEEFREYALRPAVQICLEVNVDAVGIESAAEEARRTVLRLIDTLSAVHPTAQLRPTEIVGIKAPRSGKFTVHRFQWRSPGIIRGTLDTPSSPLKESIRAAALIRRLEDPLTRAAFSWVSFETAGIKINDVKACGKALALFSLRQEAILSYRHLVRGVGDMSGLTSRYMKESKLAKKRARRLGKHRPQQYKDSVHLAGLIEAQEHLATQKNLAHEVIAERFHTAVDLVNRLSVCPPGYEFGKNGFTQIVNMTSWQDQLTAINDGDTLHELMSILPPWATVTANETGNILSHNEKLSTWLRSTADYYGNLLDGLYSARNVHLHSGVSDVPGSTSLGLASALLSDALIEICLLWQTSIRHETPMEIIDKISHRFDQVLDKTSSYKLDLDEVLAPTKFA